MPLEPDAAAALERWNRKHYRFTVSSGGNFQPGDGVCVELSAGGRKVCVCEEELHRFGEMDEPDYFATVGDVILEAIRRWHADVTPKRIKLSWFDPNGGWPPGLLCTSNMGEYVTVAKTEADAVEKVFALYRNAGRSPPTTVHAREMGPATSDAPTDEPLPSPRPAE